MRAAFCSKAGLGGADLPAIALAAELQWLPARGTGAGKTLAGDSSALRVLPTIDHSLVLRTLGGLEEEDRHALRDVLRTLLGD